MDSDYDDDIADEDLVAAFSQAPPRDASTSAAAASGRPPPHKPAPARTAAQPDAQSARDHRPAAATRGQPQHRAEAYGTLDGLPSDAFSSSEDESFEPLPPSRQIAASRPNNRSSQGLTRPGPQAARQTTLFGGRIDDSEPTASQPGSGRVYRGDIPTRLTHHELNAEALRTWVYPTNLGTIRSYQYSIVHASLFQNTLVALPTGLGKTFIAAAVMLNFYRWTKTAKIVFVAPTKPLAAQQVDACFHIAGIPRSETTLLTGETSPALRTDEWKDKRVFFMTPQTLLNDLSHGGYVHPKEIALLVVDEAHRATGSYAYASVVKLMRRLNDSFRVLALTATPGSKVETVQEVIDNLGIAHVEIRTEESMDIRQYVHSREIEQVLLDPSDEILQVQDLLRKALKPLVDKLAQQNVYSQRDPMNYTLYGLRLAQEEWQKSAGRHVPDAVKGMMRSVFQTLQSVAHSIKLLNFHGIKPFYDNVKPFRQEVEARGEKGSKYRWNLVRDPNFQEMMTSIEKWLRLDNFVGHPKITELTSRVLNHFMDHGADSGTCIIVFVEYRDSAEEIVRILNKQRPLIRATVFVGQAKSKNSEGMAQTQQIETIKKFKDGVYNVLVATSIGEEGLDIGQVDMVICYDASGSPIRMLQRMGRTGRKKAGNIILLLMRGKEEEAFAKSKDNYLQMQRLISEKTKFNFRHDLSQRIVPRDVQPEVDKRQIEIPVENTQNTSLPEPRKRKPPGKKKPPKKFHLPDGVETGFTKASATLDGFVAKTSRPKPREPQETDFLAEVPSLESVLLTDAEYREFDQLYAKLPFHKAGADFEEVTEMSLGRHPELQRVLRPTSKFRHGEGTKRCVKLLQTIAKLDEPHALDRYPDRDFDDCPFEDLPLPTFANEREAEDENPASRRGRPPASRGRKRARATAVSEEKDAKDTGPSPPKRRKPAATRPSKAAAAFVLGYEDDFDEDMEFDEDENEDEDEDEPQDVRVMEEVELPPKKRGRPRKGATTARGRKRGAGVGSSELGDDCERDSDAFESDGSDDGADLVDFIVSDRLIPSEDFISSGITAELQSSAPRGPARRAPRSTSPTSVTESPSSDPLYKRHGRGQQARRAPSHHQHQHPELEHEDAQSSPEPFFVPTEFPATQDVDDDGLPALSQVLGGANADRRGDDKKRRRGSTTHGERLRAEGAAVGDPLAKVSGNRRRRRVLDDSDDD